MNYVIRKGDLYMGDKKGFFHEWVPLEDIEKVRFMPFITASQIAMTNDGKVVSAREILTEYIKEHQK